MAEPVTGCLARGGRVTRPSLLLPLRSGRDWAGGERRDAGGTTLGGAGAASTHTILLRRRGQEQDSDDTSDMSLLFVSNRIAMSVCVSVCPSGTNLSESSLFPVCLRCRYIKLSYLLHILHSTDKNALYC